MVRPKAHSTSTPKRDGYAYKREFYRDAGVAADYDRHRFTTPARLRRNARKWRAIELVLQATDGVRSILDVPCGTGRFTGALADRGLLVVGSDVSIEMMRIGAEKTSGHENVAGHVQADAEHLPLRAGAVDCVMSIRFLFHCDAATRVRILREMQRVSRRWLIVDYRHRYSYRWVKWRVLRALGLTRAPLERVTTAQLHAEFAGAGLTVRRIVAVNRVFSDKWVVLGEPTRATDSSPGSTGRG